MSLYKAGAGGITAYKVHGMSEETSTPLYTPHPFEVHRLPDAVKLEVICADESIEKIINLIARGARTGDPGDGLIAVQEVMDIVRIIEQPS